MNFLARNKQKPSSETLIADGLDFLTHLWLDFLEKSLIVLLKIVGFCT